MVIDAHALRAVALLPLVVLAHAQAVAPVPGAHVVVSVLALMRAPAGEVALDAVAVLAGLITAGVENTLGNNSGPVEFYEEIIHGKHLNRRRHVPLRRAHKHFVVATSAASIDRHARLAKVRRVDAATTVLLAARNCALSVPVRVKSVA